MPEHTPLKLRTARDTHGFTLIELTVVLAVIVTLPLILTPSITNFINDARVARAQSDTQTTASTRSGRPPATAAPACPRTRLTCSYRPATCRRRRSTVWVTGSTDTYANQLLSNTPAYTMRTATTTFGWNRPLSLVASRG